MFSQKNLEIVLSQIEGFSKPKPELEQWQTPGSVAAKMVLLAKEDLAKKTVCDLGAGTGVLSIASYFMGAKKIIAVEIDSDACKTLERNAKKLGIEINVVNSDVKKFKGDVDTVIMNPPFGAQFSSRHSDKMFLEKAFSIAKVVYSLHLKKTRSFIRTLSKFFGMKEEVIGTFKFPLPASFSFHKKPKKIIEVDYFRIWK